MTKYKNPTVQRWFDSGLCIGCGGDRDRAPILTCSICKDRVRKNYRNKRTENLKQGLCVCGNPLRTGTKWCQSCHDKTIRWRKDNPEKWEKSQRTSRIKYRPKARKKAAEYRTRDKELVYSHYGSVCSCCGETEPLFLTVDHVNNDGADHRKKIGVSTSAIYRWIIDNNFPEGFQVLCRNCNWGKHANGGVCPHRSH